MSDETSTLNRIQTAVSIVGGLVLAFVGGAYVTEFETFPYDTLLKRPFTALKARKKKATATGGSVVASGIWEHTRSDETGVTAHREDLAYEGYTLVVSAHRQGANLIDMNGEVVHQWEKTFRDIWDNPDHVDNPRAEGWIYWRRAHVMSDGDIVASVSGEMDTPFGYGLFRLDRDSNVVWKYGENVHHHFDVQADGSVVALIHGLRDPIYQPVDGLPQMDEVTLTDSVVKLDSAGNEVKRVSLIDAILQSPFREMFTSYPKFIIGGKQDRWDPLHTNYAKVVGEEFARHHAFAEPDHVMVSLRNLDAVALLDMETERIVWATRGFWRRQHNPEPLSNGHILVFDNGGHGGPGGQSRILEYDPATHEIVWSYAGTDSRPFASDKRGTLQALPDGNVLVTESHQGRIFEVTRDGEIAWNYLNPAQRIDNGAIFTATLVSGQRYAPETLTFLD